MSNFNNMSNTLRSIIAGLALICLAIGYLLGSSRVGANGGPENLSDNYLDLYVIGLASHFSQSNDATLVKHGLCFGDALVTAEARFKHLSEDVSAEPNAITAYQQILPIVRGEQICSAHREAFLTENSSSILPTILKGLLAILLIALLLGGLAWYWMNRQSQPKEPRHKPIASDDKREGDSRSWERAMQREEVALPEPDDSEFRRAATTTPPVTTTDPSLPQPIGGFSTTYTRGDDAFDKSFIIENGKGDFLGECGVSISEYVTTDDGARNVTAFEIWLFDKNDTHTVTKVIMSDHAFGDEATRAKLAVRGESVLASLNETIALETKALIINANVNDLVYTDTNPARGIFDRFTIDLSAWVKSQLEQSSGSASDMLNF